MSPTIHLTIDRLVLDAPDLAEADVPRVLAALEHELARLLAEPAARTPLAADRLRAPDLAPGTSASDPAALGRGLARSLARALLPSFTPPYLSPGTSTTGGAP